MKSALLQFDTTVAKAIGHLPKTYYQPFVLVGRYIRPGLWMGIALLLAIIGFSFGQSVLGWTALATLLAFPISTLIKLLFRRHRPPTIYTEAMRIKSYSFPSSHSYAAALGTVLLLASLTASGLVDSIALSVLLITCSLTVAVSRVYVGAHYPSDVIGGLLLGTGVGLFIQLVAKVL